MRQEDRPDSAWRETWRQGATAHFEYHCWQSHDSADAELWYRSHQPATILKCVERGEGRRAADRADNGQPRVYRVRFQDGFEGDACEDELLTAANYFDSVWAPGNRSEAPCAKSRLDKANDRE